MFNFISDFIHKYYLSDEYNLINTLTYGLVLGFIVFKIIPVLKKILKPFDKKLALMFVPFIIYGATFRELIDQSLGIYAGHTQYPDNYMFVAPGIYFTMFVLTLACIIFGYIIQKTYGISYRLISGFIGTLLCIYNLSLIVRNIRYPEVLFILLVFFWFSLVFLFALKILLKLKFLEFEGNIIIVLIHLFDATTTFVGVDIFGYREKHVVPTLFINLFGTAAVMYPLKLIALLIALHTIDTEIKDEFDRRFVKFVIAVLGAGPAIRNTTLLLLGSNS